MSQNDVVSDINEIVEEKILEEENELSWDDIQTLGAVFVVSVLASAAHKGSIFWTLMFLLSIIVCGIWWAYDKTDQIGDALTKSKPTRSFAQFHDEF